MAQKAAQEEQEKTRIAEQAKKDAEELTRDLQKAVVARVSAEQELSFAKQRAEEAEAMAKTSSEGNATVKVCPSVWMPLQEALSAALWGQASHGIYDYELILEIGSGASAQVCCLHDLAHTIWPSRRHQGPSRACRPWA